MYSSPLIDPNIKVVIVTLIALITVRICVVWINLNKQKNSIDRAHYLFFLFLISNLTIVALSLLYLIPRNGIIWHPELSWLIALIGVLIGFPGSILFRRVGISLFKLKEVLSLQDIMPIFNPKPIVVNLWFINLAILKPAAEELLLRGVIFYTLWGVKPSIQWMIVTIFVVFIFQCLVNENIVSIFDNLFRTLLLVGIVIATGSILPGIIVNASISILQGAGLTTMLIKKAKKESTILATATTDNTKPT